MGSKLKPGAFDCINDAEPDEPFFTLLGRDKAAPAIVRAWAKARAEQIAAGEKPATDALKVMEAYECADLMEKFRARRERESNARLGVPVRGPDLLAATDVWSNTPSFVREVESDFD